MNTQRIIQCAGTNEEDTAHLRLLLRAVRTQVSDSWAWGPEARADLVIVNTRRLIGESAMRRAAQRGVDCAQVIDPDDPKPAGLFLRRPFRRDAFAMLLNKVGRGAGTGPEVDTWSDEFFDLDLGNVDLSQLEAAHPGARDSPVRPLDVGETHEDFESMRSGDTLPEPSRSLNAKRPGESVEPDLVTEGAASDAARGEPSVHSLGGAVRADEIVDPSFSSEVEADIDEDATYPLIYYLEKGVLGGPARIALRGAPILLVDPEEQFFWAQGLLPALEPYAREPLRYGDWQRLNRAELEKARRNAAARPFVRLIWMDSFIHSKGFLAKHFDPGGDYRLTSRIDLSLDYPRAYRVGTHMTKSRKLHEIARVSSVGLAEVFDVVNAYEAIGCVEWTRRERVPR
jgi:hypothetical protein